MNVAPQPPRPTSLTRTICHLPPASSTSSGVSASPSPTLIILTTWMSASPRSISLYTTAYSSLFPHAQIFILSTPWYEFSPYAFSSVRSGLRPVVDALVATPAEETLLAIYSNGGALKMGLLAEAYRDVAGKALEARAMVMDSCPDRGSVARGMIAMQMGLPVAALRLLAWTVDADKALQWAGKTINDPEVIGAGARRVYVFSKTDPVVSWSDALAHAREAEEKGWRVRIEEFEGSGHVAHVKVDGARYWRLMKELWSGKGGEKL